MAFDFTRREAEIYLGGLFAFVVGVIGIPTLGHHQANVELSGAASLLILIPFSAAALIVWVGYRVGGRAMTPLDQRPIWLVAGMYSFALMCFLGVPEALLVLRQPKR